ncbi:glutamate-cysteine ligase family protein [Nonomuraea wenchangensis]
MNSQLTERIAIEWIRNTAFSSRRVGRVGIELEWLLVRDDSPDTRVDVADVKAYLGIDDGPLPSGGYVTFEPGGQLELSTAPADSLAECLEAATRDLEVLRSGAVRSGLTLLGRGLLPEFSQTNDLVCSGGEPHQKQLLLRIFLRK